MLRKKDNPELFQEIAIAYSKITKDFRFRPYSATSLTDEQLQEIKALGIDKHSAITSLKGLSQLKNLESLSIRGNDYIDCIQNFDWKKKLLDFDKEKELKNLTEQYEINQISDEDLQEIYALKNLKSIDLIRQRHITEFDLSQLPKLENMNAFNCTDLETVKGMSECRAIEEGNSYNLDFSGCDRLKNVENLSEVIDKIAGVKSQTLGSRITLPTTTYARFYRENRDASPKVLENWEKGVVGDVFRFTDTCQGGVRYEHNPSQMRMATNRCEDIIRTVNADNPDHDFKRLANWYRWICDNVTYDHEGLDIADNSSSKSQRDRMNNVIRSTFETLWRKTGVCVGIRNLFNYGAELMNFSALPVDCKVERVNDKDKNENKTVIADHSLSVMMLKDQDGNEQPMFCDPTFDLHSDQSRFFLLTLDEMENWSHIFTIESERYRKMGTPITKSLFIELTRMGALKTKLPKQETKENL